MTADPNIDLDLEPNPFSHNPAGDPVPPSPVIDAAEKLKEAAGSSARRLRDAAEAGFRTFSQSGEAKPAQPATPSWDEMRDKLKELHREGEVWARQNPTAAVAIAAGAGLVLGLLLKR